MATTIAVQAAYKAANSVVAAASTGEQREAIILQELPQVYYIAARILERLPSNVQLEDLVNAGTVGLLEAYNSFDHTRNAQFRTFAKFRIRGAILDSLRLLDWGSRGLRRRAREIAEVTDRLAATLGRKPANQEIADAMNLSLDVLESSMMHLDGLQIVGQQVVSSGDGEEVHDLIESAPSTAENPFEACLRGEMKAHLTEAIRQLSEREQLVLSLYYREQLTMKQVAEVVGIALSRVSQIHNTAIGKLRTILAGLQTGAAGESLQ